MRVVLIVTSLLLVTCVNADIVKEVNGSQVVKIDPNPYGYMKTSTKDKTDSKSNDLYEKKLEIEKSKMIYGKKYKKRASSSDGVSVSKYNDLEDEFNKQHHITKRF